MNDSNNAKLQLQSCGYLPPLPCIVIHLTKAVFPEVEAAGELATAHALPRPLQHLPLVHMPLPVDVDIDVDVDIRLDIDIDICIGIETGTDVQIRIYTLVSKGAS